MKIRFVGQHLDNMISSIEEFAAGSTILVDKPLTWTSFDVVNKIRWNLKQQLGVKKIKVGHAGTLDPLATGLLVLCIGKHTKQINDIMVGTKTYTGTILLGKTTPSFDMETEFNQEFTIDHITEDDFERVRQTFLGEQQQVPPVFYTAFKFHYIKYFANYSCNNF